MTACLNSTSDSMEDFLNLFEVLQEATTVEENILNVTAHLRKQAENMIICFNAFERLV